MAAMSDYLENKLIDAAFRGQAFTFPAVMYAGLLNSAPTDAGGGTEVTGGGYARVAITSGLTAWAGTQGAASTTASSGTSGTTSNNAAITFPTPTAAWSTTTTPTGWVGLYDAATGGNLLFYATLAVAKVINQGDNISFAAAQLAFQIDN